MIKKNYLFLLTLVVGLFTSCGESAKVEEVALIPTPLESNINLDKAVKFQKGMVIGFSDEALKPAAQYLETILAPLAPSVASNRKDATITLTVDSAMDIKDGGYKLTTSKGKATIVGKDYSGVISGIASLRQLLPISFFTGTAVESVVIPTVSITDAPRFGWRGLMLDSSRHFWNVDEVKHIIDLMANYKLNRFHWHLTDDQGWRIEIKKYPLLTEKGGFRKFNSHDRVCFNLAKRDSNTDYLLPEDRITEVDGESIYGGFYTQEQIKDIVAYAGQRGIEVIPEIDMPGHFLAAIEQYPEVACDGLIGWGADFSSPVCVGSDASLEFCKDVYREVFELFPFEFVHMGGDEVEKTNWSKCKDCQRRIKEEGLKSVDDLQAWFVRDIEKFFNENGKRLIGWDEVVEDGLGQSSTIMWWRGWHPQSIPTATSRGMNAINTHNVFLYFDYEQDNTTLEKLLGYNPIVEGLSQEQADLILGVQANTWAEWIPSKARLEYMIMPRMLALSEIAWANLENKMTIEKFNEALALHTKWMDVKGINYRVPDIGGFFDTNVFTDETVLDLDIPTSSIEVRYTTDGTMPTKESTLYTGPIKITDTTEFKLRTFRPNGTPSDTYTTKYTKTPYMESVKVDNVKDGLVAKWYSYRGDKCAEIDKAPFKGDYPTNTVSIPEGVKGNVGLVINGYIDIPADGIYTFALLSDDGSTMTIGGEMVINNDGPHSPKELMGQAALKAGLHPIQVRYFDHNGGTLRLNIIDENGNRTTPDAKWFKN